MFRLQRVFNWAVESESKSHEQDHHQHNWKKLYRAHQSWEECDSCITSNVIFWALISSNRKKHLEIVALWSPSVSLNTTVICCLATRSFFVFLRRLQICEYLLVITPRAVAIRIPHHMKHWDRLCFVWSKGNFLFNCTVFCPVWFSFILVFSDSLTFICAETSNNVSLSLSLQKFQKCSLSDLSPLCFRKPPFMLFAVYRTGFLTYSCTVKDAVFCCIWFVSHWNCLFLNQRMI